MKLEFDDLNSAFKSGAILSADREYLEAALMTLASVMIMAGHNQQRAHQMGETIRMLLARKDSQDAERRALGVARAALWVAVAALVLGAAQLAASLWPG